MASTSSPESSLNSPRRILFVRTDRLGEVLLNLPAVAALHAAQPEVHLAMMVSPNLSALLKDVPEIDSVIEYRDTGTQPWWLKAVTLACQLRRERFDVAVISNPKKEFHLATFLAGIPRRIGYNRKGGWLLTDRLPDRKALGELHEVEYNLNLVRSLGFPTTIPQWRLPHLEREQHEVLQLLEQRGMKRSEPFIAVHPWTSNPLKQWPLDRYQALIRMVVQRLSLPVALIGGPEERQQAEALLSAGVPMADLVGQLTLRQLAALLQRARLLVSNDSGPVHLAAAVGTPTVVLFGTPDAATGPRRWGPWGEGHVVIWKPSMDAITVGEVFAALQQRLS